MRRFIREPSVMGGWEDLVIIDCVRRKLLSRLFERKLRKSNELGDVSMRLDFGFSDLRKV